jgi:hypothetical protein
MIDAGLRVAAYEDIGRPGKYVGTRTIFACGCERIYKGELGVPGGDSEHIRPCETHRNLLTHLHERAHDLSTGGKGREQQEPQT